MNPFERDFRRFVQPRLRAAITRHARRVATGHKSYADACDNVMRLAIARGAGYLSEPVFSYLYCWVLDDLAAAINHEQL